MAFLMLFRESMLFIITAVASVTSLITLGALIIKAPEGVETERGLELLRPGGSQYRLPPEKGAFAVGPRPSFQARKAA
jgi:hypothetical protein